MYKRKLHKEISSGLLVLIVAFSLTGCGSSRDALEISDTESAQAEGISQETATATPPPHRQSRRRQRNLSRRNLPARPDYTRRKPMADQSRSMLPGNCRKENMGCCHILMTKSVSVWGNGAEDCLVIHDGDREYKVGIPWRNMYSAPPAVEAADYDGDGDKEYYISTIQGTGTGIYVEGLYYVDVQKGTPKVFEYTQVSKILTDESLRRISWMNSSIHFMWIS